MPDNLNLLLEVTLLNHNMFSRYLILAFCYTLHIRLMSLQVTLSAKLCIGMVVLVWKALLLVWLRLLLEEKM
jgi:hypothetical protein